MIQSPVTAMPVGGRAMSPWPAGRSAGQGGGFGDWIGPAPSEGADVSADETPVDEVEDEVMAGDSVVEPVVIRAEWGPGRSRPPLPAGTGTEGEGTDDAPAIRLAVSLGAGMTANQAPPPDEGTILSWDAGQVAPMPMGDSARPGDAAPDTGRPVMPMGDGVGQTVPVMAAPGNAQPAMAPVRSMPAPAPILRQVADAVVRTDGDLTEIALAPAELGAMRIALSRDAGGLVVTLTAERPEVLDLLRRHMDLLRQELAAQGEEGVRLDFSAMGQGDGFAQADRSRGASHPVALSPGQVDRPGHVETTIRPALSPGRIDIRI